MHAKYILIKNDQILQMRKKLVAGDSITRMIIKWTSRKTLNKT